MLSDVCHAAAKPLVSASVIGMTGYAGAFCGGGPELSRGVSRSLGRWRHLRHGRRDRHGRRGAGRPAGASHAASSAGPRTRRAGPRRHLRRQARSPSAASALPAVPSPRRRCRSSRPMQVRPDDIVVDLRGLDEAPVSPFAGARRLVVDTIDELGTPDGPGRAGLPQRPAGADGGGPAARARCHESCAGGPGLKWPGLEEFRRGQSRSTDHGRDPPPPDVSRADGGGAEAHRAVRHEAALQGRRVPGANGRGQSGHVGHPVRQDRHPGPRRAGSHFAHRRAWGRAISRPNWPNSPGSRRWSMSGPRRMSRP